MTWATIYTDPFGGADYDPEALPNDYILSADFLNTFAEALDERLHIMYPQDEYTPRFTKGEIINSTFKTKLMGLVDGYRLLFANYTWVDPYMYSNPEEVNTSYIIAQSDVETMLADTDTYNTIFNISSYQSRWDKLKRVALWSGLYKMYKYLECYTVDWQFKNGTLDANVPCLQSMGKIAGQSPLISNSGYTLDLATLETDTDNELDILWATPVDIQTSESSISAGFTLDESNGTPGDPEFWVWETSGQRVTHDVIDLQCKRKSDDFVLTMEYSIGMDITNNSKDKSWSITVIIDDGGGTVNDSGSSSALSDIAYSTGRNSLPIVRSQQTPSYGSDGTTQLIVDYDYIIDYNFAGITDVYADIGFRSTVDAYQVLASCFVSVSYSLLAETYIKVNNSALDYYIAP